MLSPARLAAVAAALLVTLAAAAHAQDQAKLVGWLELSGPLPDYNPVAGMLSDDPEPSLRSVLSQLRTVAEEQAYQGVIVYLDQPDLSLSQVAEIDSAMQRVRAAGKKVMTFSEQYDLRSYLLACGADLVLLQRKGQLELTGLGVEEMYLAGLLAKVGAKADFVQVGRFKGAADPLTNTQPSPEWSQNIDALLDDAYDQVVARIAQARGLDRAAVEKAMLDSWTMSDQDYVDRKLVDRLVDRDLLDVTDESFGEDFEYDQDMGQGGGGQRMDNPLVMFRILFQGAQQQVSRPSIAIIRASGEIHSGESASAGGQAGLFGGDSIGSRTIVRTLGEVRDNELIKGVILRLDSPGGSAVASEVMWQAIRDVADVKPVYVSIGSVAASGGYYMACAGTRVYVSPSSIVGSIGVVGGKIVLGGLYEKVGIGVTQRTRGPMGSIFNSVTPFDEQQRAALQSAMTRIYDQFVDRVRTGRQRKIADVAAVAEGRLFTGRQAVLNGMADELGGLDAAITDLARELNLAEGSYDLIDLPEPPTFAEMLERLFSFGATAPAPELSLLQSARLIVGDQAWTQVQSTLDGLMLLRREPAVTLMPVIVRIR